MAGIFRALLYQLHIHFFLNFFPSLQHRYLSIRQLLAAQLVGNQGCPQVGTLIFHQLLMRPIMPEVDMDCIGSSETGDRRRNTAEHFGRPTRISN